MIGRPITSTRWIRGSATFCGRLERTRVTASLMSLIARSVLVSSANWMVVTDRPSVIEEVMWRTPSTPETPSSMVLVTCDSSSAGAAPNCATATEITGMSAEGRCVTASFMKLSQPSTSRMIEKTTEGSGFRIDQAEILSAISVPVDRVRRRTWLSPDRHHAGKSRRPPRRFRRRRGLRGSGCWRRTSVPPAPCAFPPCCL